MHALSALLYHGVRGNARTTDIGLALLRIATGLAFALVFEKVLPRDGVWGPQPWFVADVAAMGFPFPTFFAWAAALSEFVGGILLVVGFLTRPAALVNVIVMIAAVFLHHEGDIAQGGLLAATFLVMVTTLLLTGPGRFSLDSLIADKLRARSDTDGSASAHSLPSSLAGVGLLAVLLSLAACSPRYAPSTSPPPDLAQLAGAWQGQLTYTDYSDDTSRTSLPITADVRAVEDPDLDASGMLFDIVFTEPDGSPGGISRTLITPLPGTSDRFGYDGEAWTVIESAFDGDGFSIVIEKEGDDNRRQAAIRHVLSYRDGTLQDRKLVRYEGAADFFERSVIALVRS